MSTWKAPYDPQENNSQFVTVENNLCCENVVLGTEMSALRQHFHNKDYFNFWRKFYRHEVRLEAYV